jgi:hypothetical protein
MRMNKLIFILNFLKMNFKKRAAKAKKIKIQAFNQIANSKNGK